LRLAASVLRLAASGPQIAARGLGNAVRSGAADGRFAGCRIPKSCEAAARALCCFRISAAAALRQKRSYLHNKEGISAIILDLS